MCVRKLKHYYSNLISWKFVFRVVCYGEMLRLVVLAFLVVLCVDNEPWQLNALIFLGGLLIPHIGRFFEWRLTLI